MSPAPSSGLFIHDFVKVDLPYDAVVAAFTYFVSPALISQLAVEAWRCESAEVGRVLASVSENDGAADTTVEAKLGPIRARDGALALSLSWRADSGGWLPGLDADLEIAGFGPDRAHLHVLGLSQLPPGIAPCTDRASLDHRLTVAFVRHVIASLAELLVARAGDMAEPTRRPGTE